MTEYEEGGWCPNCDGGILEYYTAGCTCFIVAPCSACTNGVLKCEECGWDTDDEVIEGSRVMRFDNYIV